MRLLVSGRLLPLSFCMRSLDKAPLSQAARKIQLSHLPDRLVAANLLRPALLSRYDPLVVESALFLYQAEILDKNLIFRYCNVVNPEFLGRICDLLEYDGFLIERIVSQMDLFDLFV